MTTPILDDSASLQHQALPLSRLSCVVVAVTALLPFDFLAWPLSPVSWVCRRSAGLLDHLLADPDTVFPERSIRYMSSYLQVEGRIESSAVYLCSYQFEVHCPY
jgi:hypothetical protein